MSINAPETFAPALLRAVAEEAGGHAEGPALARRIIAHGVAGLLAGREHIARRLDSEALTLVEAEARAQAMWDLRQRAALQALFDRLAPLDCRPVLLKGTALAYSLYRDPAMRARGDADLLVPSAHLAEVRRALIDAGFVADFHRPFGYQEQWRLADGGRPGVEIDLHWRTLNAPALAELLPHGTIAERGALLARLHPAALRPGGADMSVHLACHWAIARFGRYRIGDREVRGFRRLVWLHDIALQWLALSASEQEDAVAIAGAAGLGAVVDSALRDAAAVFALDLDPALALAMRRPPADSGPSRYLLGTSRLARGWADAMAITPPRRRAAYVLSRLGDLRAPEKAP